MRFLNSNKLPLILLIPIIIIGVLLLFVKSINTDSEEIQTLERLGYFKFVAQEDLPKVKLDVQDWLKDESIVLDFERYINEGVAGSSDYRAYAIDAEELMPGGVDKYLGDMTRVFQILNIQMEFNHSEINEDGYTISLNNKEVTIYNKADLENSDRLWLTSRRFMEIINNELNSNGIEERIYVLYPGEHEQLMIFLNPPLRDYLKQLGKEYPRLPEEI